jgi:hypothetical protein
MSKVIGFRLSEDNPREAQAMDVIGTWVSQCYSLRHILTDALIKFRNNEELMIMWDSIYKQLADIAESFEFILVEKT